MITISMQYFGNNGAASGKSGGAAGGRAAKSEAEKQSSMKQIEQSLKNPTYGPAELELEKSMNTLPDGTKLYTGQTHFAPGGSKEVYWEKDGNYWNYLGTGSGYGYTSTYNLIDKELIPIKNNKNYKPRLVK